MHEYMHAARLRDITRRVSDFLTPQGWTSRREAMAAVEFDSTTKYHSALVAWAILGREPLAIRTVLGHGRSSLMTDPSERHAISSGTFLRAIVFIPLILSTHSSHPSTE